MPATYIGSSAISSSASQHRYRKFARNLAVIIGINDYTNGIRPLYTAHNDAIRLTKVLLSDHSYSILLFINPAAVESLQAQLTPEQKERLTLCGPAEKKSLESLLSITLPHEVNTVGTDRLIFYFAGHGIKLLDENEEGPRGYLIPQDASRDNPESFLPMLDFYKTLMELKPCHHFLLILDCCFAGAIRWSIMRDMLTPRQKITWQRYQMFVESPAWQAITSSAYDQLAIDSVFGQRAPDEQNQANSPFALALIDALQGKADTFPPGVGGQPAGDGLLTAQELHQYIRDRVQFMAKEQANHTQAPGLWPMSNHQSGEFVFQVPGRNLSLSPDLPEASKIDPYRSLEPYSEEHSQIFFGRAKATEELVERVRKNRFTVVLGASGVGKSSLVKAGLLPALRKDQATTWQIMLPPLPTEQAAMKGAPRHAAPMTPTESPLTRLAAVVQSSLSLTTPLDLSKNDSPAQLVSVVKNWLSTHDDQMLLLVIDQFEEMVTRCPDHGEREQMYGLLGALLGLENDCNFRLVLTLRSDFEPRFATLPKFNDFWGRVQPEQDINVRYVTRLMTRQELREVIEMPAAEYALYFKPYSLVDSILNDVEQMPGALPLLSFTLSLLYQRFLENKSDDRALTEEDYREIGGVIGALSTQAEKVYQRLGKPDSAHQETMQRILIRMLSIEGGIAVKRPVPWVSSEEETATNLSRNELYYTDSLENQRVKTVIDDLVHVRLLTVDSSRDGTTVQPAHDALIDAWERIDQWRSQERDDVILLQRQITDDANEWRQATDPSKKTAPASWLALIRLRYDQISTGSTEGHADLLWHNSGRLPRVAELWKAPKPKISDQRRYNQAERRGENVEPYPLSSPKPFWLNAIESKFIEQSMNRLQWNRRFRTGIVVAVFLVLLSATIYSNIQRTLAQTQTHLATARALIADVIDTTEIQPIRSLLLTVEAYQATYLPDSYWVPRVERALTSLLYRLGGIGLPGGHLGQITTLVTSVDGHWLLSSSANWDTNTLLWDLTNRERAPLLLGDFDTSIAEFSSDNRWLAVQSQEGKGYIWDLHATDIVSGAFRISDDAYQIRDIKFIPSQNTLATAHVDGHVRLWTLTDSDPSMQILPLQHKKSVESLEISPNGQWLVSIDDSGTSLLWDVTRSDSPVTAMNTTDEEVVSVAQFDSNSQWLVAGHADGKVKIWELTSGLSSPLLLRFEFQADEGSIAKLRLSPDRHWLVTASSTIRLWDLTLKMSGTSPIELGDDQYINGGQHISQILISADSAWLVLKDMANYPILYDLRTANPGENPIRVKYTPVNSTSWMAIDPKSKWIAVGDSDAVNLWRLTNVTTEPTFHIVGADGALGRRSPNVVTFSNDGNWLIAGFRNGSVRLWDLVNESFRAQPITKHFGGNSLAISPEGRWLATVDKQQTAIWNLENQDVGDPILPLPYVVVTAAFSMDGDVFAAVDNVGIARSWDLNIDAVATAASEREISTESPVTALNVNSEIGWLVTGHANGGIHLWNNKPGNELLSEPILSLHPGSATIRALTLSKDGNWLAVGDSGNILRLWKLERGESFTTISATLELEDAESYGDFSAKLAISPGGHWLLSTNSTWVAYVWDLQAEDFAKRIELSGQLDSVYGYAFTPDDTRLITGFGDETARIWPLNEPEPSTYATILSGHSFIPIDVVTTSADGAWLATGSGNTQPLMFLWNLRVENPESQPLELNLPSDASFGAFSDDGRFLIVATDDGTVYWWQLDIASLIELACQTAGRNLSQAEWQFYMPRQTYERTCESLPDNLDTQP